MISEVDIRDWLNKCDQVDKDLDQMYPYQGPAFRFIDEVRDYFKSQQKQVAALFKPPGSADHG